MLDPAFGYLIVTGIALLLASAAIQKFSGLARFADIVVAYRVLPGAIAGPAAWLVPCLEAAIAAALLWTPTRSAAAMAAMMLLIGYASGVGVNLLRGRRDLDCGCGAARDRRPIAAWMVWRNLLLAVTLLIAVPRWSQRALDFSDLLTIVGGLAVAITLYAAADRLFGDVAPRARLLRSHS
jgi:hypothetical protein